MQVKAQGVPFFKSILKYLSIMKTNQIKVKDLVCGITYRFSGDVMNGNSITHENVVRRLVSKTSTHLVLECGRRFIINKNLIVTYY